jgi:serine/threonine protein phosphatase PrpC
MLEIILMGFQSFARTVRNTHSAFKPNEDYFVADDQKAIYIVADGITTTPKTDADYPNPSGGQLTSRLFCETVYQFLLAQPDITRDSVYQSLLRANEAIFALNQAHGRYERANFVDEDYYGTVATVAVVIAGCCVIYHVGDTLVLWQNGTSLERITESQTQGVAAYKWKINAIRRMISRELTVAIRRDFRNHLHARGMDGEAVGYGVFTGEPGVVDFIRSYERPIPPGTTFLMTSDGFEPLVSQLLSTPALATEFCQRLAENPNQIDWLFEQNQRIQDRHDDKTGLIISSN